jgi:hypothetical protein
MNVRTDQQQQPQVMRTSHLLLVWQVCGVFERHLLQHEHSAALL